MTEQQTKLEFALESNLTKWRKFVEYLNNHKCQNIASNKELQNALVTFMCRLGWLPRISGSVCTHHHATPSSNPQYKSRLCRSLITDSALAHMKVVFEVFVPQIKLEASSPDDGKRGEEKKSSFARNENIKSRNTNKKEEEEARGTHRLKYQ